MRASLFACVFSTVAAAQPAYTTRTPGPGTIDVRANVEAELLLSVLNVGVSGEAGLVPIANGTLGAGLEASYMQCFLGCGSTAAVQVERRAVMPLARGAYHFIVGGETQNVSSADVYAVALAGAAIGFQHTEILGAGFDHVAVVPVVGAGLGSLYFPGGGDSVFAGGEARFLFAPTLPAADDSTLVGSWQITGVRFVFSLGARF